MLILLDLVDNMTVYLLKQKNSERLIRSVRMILWKEK